MSAAVPIDQHLAGRPSAPRAGTLAKVIVAINVVLAPIAFVAGIVLMQYSSQYGSAASGLLFSLGTMVQVGVTAAVVFKRPGHVVGWLLLASVTSSLVDSAVLTPFVAYSIHVTHRAVPGGDLVGTIDQMMWMLYVVPMAIFVPLVFPTGKLLSRRWRVVVWIACAATVVGFFGGAFGPSQDPATMGVGVRPVVIPEPFRSVAGVMAFAIALLPACVLAAVVAMVLRYRRGSADERHQLKWLIAAVTVYLVGFLGSVVPTVMGFGRQVSILQDVSIVGLALVPVAEAIAVLKYRLYDIDVVISRALVYAALAVFITAVYVAIVVGVGTLVGAGGKPNLVLSIVATAVVAVAFQPVRERVQKVASRLVYGKRATPYEVLSEFSTRVAESYVGEEVLPRMAEVLAEGTAAERVEVWARAGEYLRSAAAWPGSADAPAAAPIKLHGQLLPSIPGADRTVGVYHQGELLGALTVSKRPGESLTPIEEKLLDHLAQQAGLVLRNVVLTASLQERLVDLRASRQRLVQAQDDERRKLERNLHDGAQQHLVAIKVKLGLAERLATTDLPRAQQAIQQLKADADEALETLRDLARGIYPPLLADRGLEAALTAQARKVLIPVTIEATGIGRYSQETEAAVYFCCLEGLQNIQKYAMATSATVRLQDAGERLAFDVEDDGRGFDPVATGRGSGLQNIEDRLDALGGSLTLVTTVGRGTRLSGSLPLPAEAERDATAGGHAGLR